MAKDLKNKIKNAYENETPDFKERIISACEKETQAPMSSPVQFAVVKQQKRPFFFHRLVAVMSCLILFGVGLFVGKIIPDNQPIATAETCVYFDVNPSLELALDENNTVLSCTAANEDAEIILNGMKLEGVELKTALNAIVGSMYVKGYLSSEDNSILISVDTRDVNNTKGFLSYITQQVNGVFTDSEMECSIIAQGVTADEDLKRRAEEQGISVGKMYLLDKMVGAMDELTENDIAELSTMSIKDLNLIYSQKLNDNDQPDDELISGKVSVKVTSSDALNAVLTSVGKTAIEVEEYRIHVLPCRQGETKIVYAVTLKFFGDATIYKYEVDCQTGEVSTESIDTFPNATQQEGGGLEENGDNPAENKEPNENPGVPHGLGTGSSGTYSLSKDFILTPLLYFSAKL